MKLRRSEIGSRLFEAKYVPSFNVRNAQEDIGQMNVSRSGHSAASKRRDQISEWRDLISQKNEICCHIAV